MKRIIIIAMLVGLVGCANTGAPVKIKWPDAPPELLAPSEDLVPLETDQILLSDLLDNANTNYEKYYILKDKYDTWQQWYKTHSQIYQDAR
jgi:hypothetical protein